MNKSLVTNHGNGVISRRIVPKNDLVRLAGGVYLYRCSVAKDSPPFSNGDLGRVGLIFCVPQLSSAEDHLHIKWWGVRLGRTLDGKTYLPLEGPIRWGGNGHLTQIDGTLEIEYVISDGNKLGIARDVVKPDGNRGDWKGSFHAEHSEGCRVHGEVHHTRWTGDAEPPKELANITFDPWLLMEPDRVGVWGEALYGLLPESEKATPDETFVCIDILTGKHVRTSERNRLLALREFQAENPGAVVYCGEYGNPSVPTFGVGATR